MFFLRRGARRRESINRQIDRIIWFSRCDLRVRLLRAQGGNRSNGKKFEHKSWQKPCEKQYAAEARKMLEKHRFWSQDGSQNRSLGPPEASSEPGWRWKPPKITPGGLWSIKILIFLSFHAFFEIFQKKYENQGRVRPGPALGRKARASTGQVPVVGLHALQRSYA